MKRSLLLCLLFTLLFAALPATAQTGYVRGFECRSADDEAGRAGYADWSTVLTLSFGTSGSWDAIGGAGRPEISPVSLVKRFDGCTTNLFKLSVQGKHIQAVEIVIVSAQKTMLLRIRLEEVIVVKTTYSPSQEAVSLSYGKIRIEHVPTGTRVEYDVSTGRAS